MRCLKGRPGAKVPAEFTELIICEKFGWTFEELQETPQFVIDRILAMAEVDAKYQKEETEKMQRSLSKTTAGKIRH